MSLESLGKRGFLTFHQVKLLDNSLIKAITNELNVKTGRYLLKTNLSTFTIDSQGNKSTDKSVNSPFITKFFPFFILILYFFAFRKLLILIFCMCMEKIRR